MRTTASAGQLLATLGETGESMRRILLVDDDPDHELLLAIAARDVGAWVVDRIDRVSELPEAILRARPTMIVLDLWVADGLALEHIDAIRALAGDLPVVIWTHDPWTVSEFPAASDLPVVDKLSKRSELLAALAAA